jgi:hypothetical protein
MGDLPYSKRFTGGAMDGGIIGNAGGAVGPVLVKDLSAVGGKIPALCQAGKRKSDAALS